MTTRATLLCAAFAVACGPGSQTQVIPTLPGDGDEHTAKPRAIEKDEGPDDPWDGREGLIAEVAPLDPKPLDLPGVTRFRLSNGLEVLAIPTDRAPVVSVQLAVRAGRADAPRDKMGIEKLVAQTLPAGTRRRDGAALRRALEIAAASMHVQASYENTLLSCQARSEGLGACIQTMAEVVSIPTFPEDRVKAARAELAENAARRLQEPAQLAALHFQNLLWGDEHVRGWPMTRRTVEAISRKDVTRWHKRWFRPDNAILAVAGDIDAASLKKQLEARFRTWRKRGKLPKRARYEVPERERVQARLVDWPGLETAHIRVGHQGLPHGDESFFRLVVANQILGGSGSSRLSRTLAEETGGRALGGTSGFDRNRNAGIFVVSAAAPAKDALAAARAALQEMTAMQKEPPSDAALEHAVTRVAGNYMTSLETASEIGNAYLAAALHDLDAERVRRFPAELAGVTANGVRDVAEKVFDPVSPAVVIVGDAQVVAPQLEAIGVGFETIERSQPIGGWEREESEPEDKKKAARQAKQILGQALKAKGGRKKLESIQSMVLQGKAKGVIHDPQAGKQTFEAEVKRTFVAPDKMRRDIVRQVGGKQAVSGIVLTAGGAWAFEKMGDKQGAGDLPPQLVKALETQMWRDQELVLLRHLDPNVTALALPDKEIDGTPHHVVRITRDDGVSSTLYIDKKTKLLRRQRYSEQGASAMETYGDYKGVGGIQVAHRRVTSEGATRFDMTVQKIQFNVKVPPELFQKPKQ